MRQWKRFCFRLEANDGGRKERTMTTRRGGIRVFALSLLVTGLMVRAGTLHVTENGTGDGSEWATAASLANALANAQENDEIWIEQGTYSNDWDGTTSFKISVENLALYGGFTNGMASREERDWTAYPTVLSGAEVRRVVTVTASNATLDGLRIQDGYLAAVVPATGIFKDTGGRLVLANCEVTRNRARQTSTTGHLLGGGGYFVSGSVLISNSVFRANGNSTKDAMRFCDGLAFYANNADVEVVGSLFESNRASYAWAQRSNLGGAIHCAGGTLRVADTRFVGNRGGSYDRTNMGGGGAVYLSGSCDARFSGCRFEDNEAWNYPIASEYTLAPGGAVWAALSSVSTVTLENCVFVNNRASECGGAIMLTSGSLTMQNCTLASNQAAIKGGALYVKNGGTIAIQNSILWSNAAADGASEIYLGSGAFSLTDSCLTGIGEDAVYGGVQMARVMTNNPLFASETDLHLKSTVARWDSAITNWTADAVDSPCIDAGDPALD